MDFASMAEKTEEVGAVCVERAGVEPGMEVLDVPCGTGNAAIPAARAGARVTGLEPWKELLDIARERAADAMVEVEWLEGDPLELPFEDRSFDCVISVFGEMSERFATELRRVSRGQVVVASRSEGGYRVDVI